VAGQIAAGLRRQGEMARTHGSAATEPSAAAVGVFSAAGLVAGAGARHLVGKAQRHLAEGG
jgi:hypothetical protein